MASLDVADAVRLLPQAEVRGAGRGAIASLTCDSRTVVPGSLFAAIPGALTDGHRFVGDAVAAGAVAVLMEREPAVPIPEGTTTVRVPDARRALARLAGAYYGEPSRALRIVGVTGTNGKTTVTYLLEAMLGRAGESVGVIGTTGVRLSGRSRPSTHTTPDGPELQRTLAQMRDAGVDTAVVEISSHALAQGRAVGTHLDVAAFVNLTRDHLDFHGEMDTYFEAKRRIVTELLTESSKPRRTLVVNLDDARAADLARDWSPVTTTSAIAGSDAVVRPRELEIDLDGIRGELVTPAGPIPLRSSLVGHFNVCNIAVAVGIALALGVDPAAIAAGLRALRRVPGRLEPVMVAEGGTGPRVLVDYAHTPDALASVLAALRPLVPGQIWTVFGCGGDRDQGKRPLMGQVAAGGSNQLVVTSDNPRGEDPQAIIDQILVGVAPVGTPHRTEVDRRAAIGAALAAAGPQDLVLIAGKGHEQVQVIGDSSRPFDDREVAREAILAGEAR